MSFYKTLTTLRPTVRRWRTWQRTEPVLAGLGYAELRREVRPGGVQQRVDELLAALVRIAKHDPTAVEILVACLWPGLRSRVARHAPGLDHDDALAIAVTGLAAAIACFPTDPQVVPAFVASRLLDTARQRLQHAVRREQNHRERFVPGDVPDIARPGPGIEPGIPAILHNALSAGVLDGPDAWLLWTVDEVGHSVGFAARQLAIGYDAARQRRSRAARRWRAWWFSEVGADRQEEATA